MSSSAPQPQPWTFTFTIGSEKMQATVTGIAQGQKGYLEEQLPKLILGQIGYATGFAAELFGAKEFTDITQLVEALDSAVLTEECMRINNKNVQWKEDYQLFEENQLATAVTVNDVVKGIFTALTTAPKPSEFWQVQQPPAPSNTPSDVNPDPTTDSIEQANVGDNYNDHEKHFLKAVLKDIVPQIAGDALDTLIAVKDQAGTLAGASQDSLATEPTDNTGRRFGWWYSEDFWKRAEVKLEWLERDKKDKRIDPDEDVLLSVFSDKAYCAKKDSNQWVLMELSIKDGYVEKGYSTLDEIEGYINQKSPSGEAGSSSVTKTSGILWLRLIENASEGDSRSHLGGGQSRSIRVELETASQNSSHGTSLDDGSGVGMRDTQGGG